MSDTLDTVVFLPCCKRKRDNGRRHDDDGFTLTTDDLPETMGILRGGRGNFEECLVPDSTPTSALHLYRGLIYGPLREEKDNMLAKIDKGLFRLFIISPVYGIVDAQEKIKDYDEAMKRNIARYWCNAGLREIIKELLLTVKPKRIFGYFIGNRESNKYQAPYRHFFTQGLVAACNDGLECDIAGCFHGRGLAGLTALGNCMLEHYSVGFSEEFAEHVEEHGCRYKNTIISFDRYCPA